MSPAPAKATGDALAGLAEEEEISRVDLLERHGGAEARLVGGTAAG
jgi:hypothetical protein